MEQSTVTIVLIILHLPLWFYLSQGALHLFIAVFSKPTKTDKPVDRKNSFALIITAHEETKFIAPLIDSILKQNYEEFHAYVVADKCDISSIEHLKTNKVSILKPEDDLNSKVRSIDYAINSFEKSHDFMIIFDPDNLLDPNYLKELNAYIETNKHKVIQTRLLPKNAQNNLAQLDALGSSYYDFISRESKTNVNLSSHIYGLGICIDLDTYKEIKYKNVVGGFDKRIQIDILKSGYKIGYCQSSIVFDEKTSRPEELEKQRTRWLHAYFKYAIDGLKLLFNGIKKLNFDWIYFGIESIRPPIVLLMATALMLSLIDLFIAPLFSVVNIVLFGIFILSYLVILTRNSENKGTIRSLIYVPKFLLILISSLLGLKKAEKTFLKTNHDHVIYIDDILKRRVS